MLGGGIDVERGELLLVARLASPCDAAPHVDGVAGHEEDCRGDPQGSRAHDPENERDAEEEQEEHEVAHECRSVRLEALVLLPALLEAERGDADERHRKRPGARTSLLPPHPSPRPANGHGRPPVGCRRSAVPRPLLCCVDDSETARAAARYARDLSRRLSLELVLVHVAGTADAPGTSAAPGGHARLADAQREEGEEALARAARDAGVGEARRRLEFGSVVGRLLAVAVDEDAEMIVLGSRGRGRMRAAALGSVAAETATKAPCPVLVVSPAAAERAGLAS